MRPRMPHRSHCLWKMRRNWITWRSCSTRSGRAGPAAPQATRPRQPAMPRVGAMVDAPRKLVFQRAGLCSLSADACAAVGPAVRAVTIESARLDPSSTACHADREHLGFDEAVIDGSRDRALCRRLKPEQLRVHVSLVGIDEQHFEARDAVIGNLEDVLTGHDPSGCW